MLEKILKNRKLETLVENQTTFSLDHAEMHLFETHLVAEKVLLKFRLPVLASMLEGKKRMHLDCQESFDFLPGQSLILPANETMCIDFPAADRHNPTRCLAMTISEEKISETIDFLNAKRPRKDGEWRFTDYNFHFMNDIAIQQIIQRLLFLFTENHASKDVFADYMLRELIIRILQTESKVVYSNKQTQLNTNEHLGYVVAYIRQNLDRELTIKELSDKVYVSESTLYRIFKNELNTSPINFINEERIKRAAQLLKNPSMKVKTVSMECGFNSLSYFIRLFKRKLNMTPKAYQLNHTGQ